MRFVALDIKNKHEGVGEDTARMAKQRGKWHQSQQGKLRHVGRVAPQDKRHNDMSHWLDEQQEKEQHEEEGDGEWEEKHKKEGA